MTNAVIEWNDTLLDTIRADKTAPPIASRAIAMVHTAIYDAVNAMNGSPFESYHVQAGPVTVSGTPEAAIAAAAHSILVSLFPTQAATLDAIYATRLNAIADGAAKTDGIAWGNSVANQILSLRGSDGMTDVVNYTPGTNPGDWQPTPPALAKGLLPQWGGVDPWAMTSGDQFRPDAPPALTSKEYTDAFNEVKTLGAKTGSTRTADQTEIALFWADGAGTATPPGHLCEIGQAICEQFNLTLLETAHLFALLGMGVADAAIISWDAKYAYNNWRPVTAIANAAHDGNPNTAPDASWLPLITTPPFPDYISGHSTFSGASAKLMELFFGNDAISFDVTSEGVPGVTRHFDSLWAAAEEAGMSRVYGGIHWDFSSEAGLKAGSALAEYIYAHFLLAQQFLTEGNDRFFADRDSEPVVRGLGGNDRMIGNRELNKYYGDAGNDTIYGDNGNDTVYGGLGNDLLGGDRDNDRLSGDTGNDTLYGGRGDDLLLGGEGNDSLQGDRDNDTVDGGDGADKVYGAQGDDLLLGGIGNDTVSGEQGSDTVDGGAGNDLLYGGQNHDIFRFLDADFGTDIIGDFKKGDILSFASMVATLIQLDSDSNGVLNHADALVSVANQDMTITLGTSSIFIDNTDGIAISYLQFI